MLFGFASLKKKYGIERLNMACARALEVDSNDFQVLKHLLQKRQELTPRTQIDNQEVLDIMYEKGFLRNQKQFEELAEQALNRSKNHEN